MANVGKAEIVLTGVMPRCRDCRFWVKSLGPEVDQWPLWVNILGEGDEGDGYCLATLEGSAAVRESAPSNPIAATTKAYAHDDEGHLAILVTAPDFGCVQFQQKEPERG